MTYKIYAKMHPNVPGFGGLDVLVESGVPAKRVCRVCRGIQQYGFLLGGEAGRKIWAAPFQIVQLWADPEQTYPPMN